YRQYDEGVVDRLRFIRRAKQLGFTLKEIRELLSLRLDPATTCGDVKSRAEAKLDDIAAKIRSLQRMKRALVKLTKACSGRGAASECPILESLDRGD
ncbi:MAG: MerR family DNA-binding protein, partial [Planctomycetes bacterium]|nr:MerR family DNA-binding protein [Planctomycetota bacterium]